MNAQETAGAWDDLWALIDSEMERLQEAMQRRSQALDRVLSLVTSAATLEELEACEEDIARRHAEIRAEFETTVHSVTARLQVSEEQLLDAALEAQLTAIADAEDSFDPAPNDLVIRLQAFLTSRDSEVVPLEVVEQKHVLARTVLNALTSQVAGQEHVPDDPLGAVQYRLDVRDIEDLTPIVEALSMWVRELKPAVSRPKEDANESPGIGRHVIPQEPIEDEPAQVEGPREKPVVADEPALRPLSPGDIARFEEDYYRHSVKFHSWLRKGAAGAHSKEIDEFKDHLDQRREELSRWRDNPGIRENLHACSLTSALVRCATSQKPLVPIARERKVRISRKLIANTPLKR